MNKDDLRKLLNQQVEQFQTEQKGEITLYAAQRLPEKQPWKRKPSLQAESFKASLQMTEEKLLKEGRTLGFPDASDLPPAKA